MRHIDRLKTWKMSTLEITLKNKTSEISLLKRDIDLIKQVLTLKRKETTERPE